MAGDTQCRSKEIGVGILTFSLGRCRSQAVETAACFRFHFLGPVLSDSPNRTPQITITWLQKADHPSLANLFHLLTQPVAFANCDFPMTLKLSLSVRFRRSLVSQAVIQGTKLASLSGLLGLATLSHLNCLAQDAVPPKQPTIGAKQGEVPPLAEASDEGETAIGSFQFPSSMRCNLFAAEPMFANPVAFSFDRFGRVFVCESYRQNKGVTDNRGHDDKWLNADLAAMNVQDRIRYHRELLGKEAAEYERFDDLIRVLIDRDGDNKADDSKIFVSGFNGIEEGTGAGVLVRDDMVYYTNIPKLWGFKDTNNDLVADERIVLSDGYGVRVAFRGHDMHGLIIGPDGRLYFSIGDRGYSIETPNGRFQDPESGAVFRCELDGSNLEIFATGLRNPKNWPSMMKVTYLPETTTPTLGTRLVGFKLFKAGIPDGA